MVKKRKKKNIQEDSEECKVQVFYFYWQIDGEALYCNGVIYRQGPYSQLAFSLHQSSIALLALTGEVNNTQYLITKAPVRLWDIRGSMGTYSP